mgnify:CR=1 FL=1
MNDLPPCRHRIYQVAADQWACDSPCVEVLGGIVTGEICRDLCPHVDHDAPCVTRSVEPSVVVACEPSLLSIAMVTAPRPVSTVERSVSELRHAGFQQSVHLFAEPGSTDIGGSDLVTHPNDEPLGAWRNWKKAAKTMLVECDSPLILLCEDDIRLARCAAAGLQAAIDRFPLRDWGFASLYTPYYNLTHDPSRSGWRSVRSPALWGALAWCFTRESLRAVLESDEVAEHRGDRDTDLVVSRAIHRLGRRTYFHVPSLGTHAGAGISSLGHAPKKASTAIELDASFRHYVDRNETNRMTSAVATLTSLQRPGFVGTPTARDDSITVVIPNYNCGDYLRA